MLRTLRNHGTPEASLKDIFRATVMAKILSVLLHGPAFVQQPTERNLMRSYEDARDPVTVN